MKPSRFTDSQIMVILKQAEAGTPVPNLCREAFQSYLQYHAITASMRRKGNCLDNAVVERFFRSWKSEQINYRRYLSRHQAVTDIIDYIEPFYSQVRRHAHLGNISLDQYEAKTLKAV